MSARPALREVEADEAPAAPPPPIPAPAIGYSILCNLDGSHQLTVQCFAGEDETDEVVNAKVDRIFRVVDRQKARYDIETIKDDLDVHEKALANLLIGLGKADLDFDRGQAQLDIQIGECKQMIEAARTKVYNDNVASGRTPDRAARGHAGANISRFETAIKSYEADKTKKVAERDQYREGVILNREKLEKEIGNLKAKLDAKEALLRG